jgi:hypothetical protein
MWNCSSGTCRIGLRTKQLWSPWQRALNMYKIIISGLSPSHAASRDMVDACRQKRVETVVAACDKMAARTPAAATTKSR